MGSGSDLTKDQYDRLLEWLDSDRDIAGARLLQICASLSRLFLLKGALESDALIDETVNRVAKRIETLYPELPENPEAVFWGFARNVFREYVKELKKIRTLSETESLRSDGDPEGSGQIESNYGCLEDCLAELGHEDSEMMRDYFTYDPGTRSNVRQAIADRMSISLGNLQVRVFRTREILKNCIKNCISEK